MDESRLDTSRLPKLVALLLEAGKREEVLVEALECAVVAGDREAVFVAATRIVEHRNRKNTAAKSE